MTDRYRADRAPGELGKPVPVRAPAAADFPRLDALAQSVKHAAHNHKPIPTISDEDHASMCAWLAGYGIKGGGVGIAKMTIAELLMQSPVYVASLFAANREDAPGVRVAPKRDSAGNAERDARDKMISGKQRAWTAPAPVDAAAPAPSGNPERDAYAALVRRCHTSSYPPNQESEVTEVNGVRIHQRKR